MLECQVVALQGQQQLLDRAWWSTRGNNSSRPQGMTVEAGYGTSGGRPEGTTVDARYSVGISGG